jgi:hypothetical protein
MQTASAIVYLQKEKDELLSRKTRGFVVASGSTDGSQSCPDFDVAAGRLRASRLAQRSKNDRNSRSSDPHGTGSLDTSTSEPYTDRDVLFRAPNADRGQTSRDAHSHRDASLGGASIGDTHRNTASPAANTHRDAPTPHAYEHARGATITAHLYTDPHASANQHATAGQHTAAG